MGNAGHTTLLTALPWDPSPPHPCCIKRRIRRVTLSLERISVPADAALLAARGVGCVEEEDSFEALLDWLASFVGLALVMNVCRTHCDNTSRLGDGGREGRGGGTTLRIGILSDDVALGEVARDNILSS